MIQVSFLPLGTYLEFGATSRMEAEINTFTENCNSTNTPSARCGRSFAGVWIAVGNSLGSRQVEDYVIINGTIFSGATGEVLK